MGTMLQQCLGWSSCGSMMHSGGRGKHRPELGRRFHRLQPYQLLPSLQQTSNLFTPKLNIKIWYRSYTHLQKQKLNQIIVTLNIKDLRVISNDASEVVVHIDHSLSQRKQESVSNYFAPIDMPNQRLL